MTFQVQDSVKDGDSVTVSAKTEELQNNNAAVSVTDVPLNAAVGRQSNNNGNNNGGNDSSTEPQTETASIMETTETEVDRITRAAPVSRPRHLPETAIPPVVAAPSAEHLPEAAVLREPRAEAARLHPQNREITPMF